MGRVGQIIFGDFGPAVSVEEQTPVLEEWPVAAQLLQGQGKLAASLLSEKAKETHRRGNEAGEGS